MRPSPAKCTGGRPPAFLEVEDHAHVGDLDDVDQVGLGLPLRQHLGVERARLQADVAGHDLGEDLVERGQQLHLALLGVGGVERERAFRLGFLDVGAGLEPLHLAGVVAHLGLGKAPTRQADHQQCRSGGCSNPHRRPPRAFCSRRLSRRWNSATSAKSTVFVMHGRIHEQQLCNRIASFRTPSNWVLVA